MFFFADIEENGFSHHSVVLEIPKFLMLQRLGSKK